MSGYSVNGVDLDNIFILGNGATATGYLLSDGSDLSSRYAVNTTGIYAPDTGYTTSLNGYANKDLSQIFEPLLFTQTFGTVLYNNVINGVTYNYCVTYTDTSNPGTITFYKDVSLNIFLCGGGADGGGIKGLPAYGAGGGGGGGYIDQPGISSTANTIWNIKVSVPSVSSIDYTSFYNSDIDISYNAYGGAHGGDTNNGAGGSVGYPQNNTYKPGVGDYKAGGGGAGSGGDGANGSSSGGGSGGQGYSFSTTLYSNVYYGVGGNGGPANLYIDGTDATFYGNGGGGSSRLGRVVGGKGYQGIAIVYFNYPT